MAWPEDVLQGLRIADGLRVAPFRPDGRTPGTPTYIWHVLLGDRLFIRPWNGPASSWYGAATSQGAGRIVLDDGPYEVTFTPADASLLDEVDAAYRTKYAGSPYLQPMLGAGPRQATTEVGLR